MKKVGIITIHNSPNYGACLQSFALYEYIRLLGYDVEIIDLHRPYHSDYIPSEKYKPYTHRFESIKQKLKRRIKDLIGLFAKRNQIDTNSTTSVVIKDVVKDKVSLLFDDFNSRIRLSAPYKGIDQLYKHPPKYDTYITGSDQVWNPTQAYCVEPYFLTFVKDGRKISYASSIGIELLTCKEKRDYANWLKGYDAISVREEAAKNILSELTPAHIDQVCDPTFLLDLDVWENMAVTPKESDYVLVFTLAYDKNLVDYGLRLAKECGKVLVCLNPVQPDADGYISVKDAGPKEWLGYIRNANLVITDSFHCTLFSILLGAKNFLTYISPYNQRGSRIIELLDMFGLGCHLLPTDLGLCYREVEKIELTPSSRRQILETIISTRSKSREFLNANI